MDIKKKFCTLRVVSYWHRLPREAVDALFLKIFKARLDWALSNLVSWKVSLPRVGVLELHVVFKVPSTNSDLHQAAIFLHTKMHCSFYSKPIKGSS